MMLEHARRARGIATMADVRAVIGSVYVDRLLRLDYNPEGYARGRAAGWWDANELDLCAAYTLLAEILAAQRAREEASVRAHRIVDAMICAPQYDRARLLRLGDRSIAMYKASNRRVKIIYQRG